MDKSWIESKTTWGAILLAVEAGLLTLPGLWLWPEVAISALGVFLTVFGIRSALE